MTGNTYHQAPDSVGRGAARVPSPRTVVATGRRLPRRPVPDRRRAAGRASHLLRTRPRPRRRHHDGRHRTVFTNPDVYASTNVQDPIFPLAPDAAAVLAADDFDPIAVMSNRPEPDHARIRVYTRQGFSQPPAEPLEDYMRGRATGLLDRMIERRLAGGVRAGAGVPVARRDRVPADRVPAGRRRADQVVVRQSPGLLVGQTDRRRATGDRRGDARLLAVLPGVRGTAARANAPTTSAPNSSTRTTPIPTRPTAQASAIGRSNRSSTGSRFAGHDPVTALLCNTLRCLLPRRDQWEALCRRSHRWPPPRSRRRCGSSRARSPGAGSRRGRRRSAASTCRPAHGSS